MVLQFLIIGAFVCFLTGAARNLNRISPWIIGGPALQWAGAFGILVAALSGGSDVLVVTMIVATGAWMLWRSRDVLVAAVALGGMYGAISASSASLFASGVRASGTVVTSLCMALVVAGVLATPGKKRVWVISKLQSALLGGAAQIRSTGTRLPIIAELKNGFSAARDVRSTRGRAPRAPEPAPTAALAEPDTTEAAVPVEGTVDEGAADAVAHVEAADGEILIEPETAAVSTPAEPRGRRARKTPRRTRRAERDEADAAMLDRIKRSRSEAMPAAPAEAASTEPRAAEPKSEVSDDEAFAEIVRMLRHES